MIFGKIIKKLRRERDMTQEELAEILEISPQAVSRWETEAAMPDISMLPVLCNIFNITSDELLGIDIQKKREKIEAICAEGDKYSSRGYYEEARKILEAGSREYPDSCDIMYRLMYVSHCQYCANTRNTNYRDEAISLGETLLEKSTDDSIRHSAIQILCFTYKDIGKIDEAIKLANSMPDIAVSKDMLLSIIYDGDEGYRANQRKADNLLQFLSNALDSMQIKLDSGEYAYTEKELAALRDKRIAFINLFFEDGNFGFYNCHLWNAHIGQAVYYANFNDIENAIFHLRKAAEHSIKFVTDNDKQYTSLVFRGLDKGSWTGGNTDNDAAQLLKQLDNNVFDVIRGTPEFEEIKAELYKYAGKWNVQEE